MRVKAAVKPPPAPRSFAEKTHLRTGVGVSLSFFSLPASKAGPLCGFGKLVHIALVMGEKDATRTVWPVWVMQWGGRDARDGSATYYFFNTFTGRTRRTRPEDFGTQLPTDESAVKGRRRRRRKRGTKNSQVAPAPLEPKPPRYWYHPDATQTIQRLVRCHIARGKRRTRLGLQARSAELAGDPEQGGATDGWYIINDFYLRGVPFYFHGANRTIVWKRPYETAVEKLLRKQAEALAAQQKLDHQLLTAARTGDVGAAKRLCAAGANPSAIDPATGRQLAHFASERALMNVLRWLGKKLSLSQCKDVHGATCMHYAARGGHINIMKFLLREGVAGNSEDKRGRTPLMYAAYYGRPEIMEWLTEKVEDINLFAVDMTGCNLVHRAVVGPYEKRRLPTVRWLISLGCDPHQNDLWGWGAVDKAASCGYEAVKTELLRHGCQLKYGKVGLPEQIEGWTIVHESAMRGDADQLRWLWKRGCDMNLPDARGETPLFHAAAGGHLDAVKALLRAGAKIGGKNNIGQTVEKLTLAQGHREVADYLEETRRRREAARIRRERDAQKAEEERLRMEQMLLEEQEVLGV